MQIGIKAKKLYMATGEEFVDVDIDFGFNDLEQFVTVRLANGKTVLINPSYIQSMELSHLQDITRITSIDRVVLDKTLEKICQDPHLSEIDDDL